MTTIEEQNYIEVIIPSKPLPVHPRPKAKPIELKNIGFLKKISTYVNCPSCLAETMSVVHLEAATFWQKFLRFLNICKTSESRYDINHYCGICGCYIGRYIDIGCYEKCLVKRARRLAANDAMTLRPEPRDCWQKLQEARKRISANMEIEREERKKKQKEEEENTKGN